MIGLLPGRFDPVHRGHVALARAAMVAGDLREVWLLAAPEPWHKAVAADHGHRLAMLELAVAGEPGLRLVAPELRKVPHTLAGFGAVMAAHPSEEFVFILGMDALGRLDRWDDYESIVRTTTLMGARRTGTDEAVVADLRARLGVLGEELKVRLFDFEHGASSTAVKKGLVAGERPADLDERVLDYIVRNGLYR